MSFGLLEKKLLSAIRHYRTQEALSLLDEDIDFEATDFFPFDTPLLLSIKLGIKPVISKLIEKGADVNHLSHYFKPKDENVIFLSEGHSGQEVNEYKCPLSEALLYEEKHNLSEEIALLRKRGAKEVDELKAK